MIKNENFEWKKMVKMALNAIKYYNTNHIRIIKHNMELKSRTWKWKFKELKMTSTSRKKVLNQIVIHKIT